MIVNRCYCSSPSSKSILDATFDEAASSDITKISSTWAPGPSLHETIDVPVNEIFAARIGDANSAALFTSARFIDEGLERRVIEVAVKVPKD